VSVQVLESITRVAPLGVRFVDDVTGETVSDGLTVLYPRAGAGAPARAAVNRSGVFVLRGLPGLADVERGRGDDAFWASALPSATATVQVHDALGRFHDVRFDARAPSRGLFAPLCGSPPSPPAAEQAVPLLSTPARVVPAGVAVLRASVRDADTGAPAAWALVEVDGGRGRGVADARGEVAVLFPYPPLESFGVSPPASSRRPLLEERWTVAVAGSYDRLPVGETPDLCAVLAQRPADTLQSLSPPTPVAPQTLTYGRELVVPGVLHLAPAP
jgi:hypothetical protein